MSIFALICLSISFLIWISYIGYIYIKYKPDCISNSYYLLNHKDLFTLILVGISFLILPAWLEITPIGVLFLPFLSVVALSTVGACPRYLESQRLAHIISTAIAVVISLIWNIVIGLYIIPIGLLIVLIILYVLEVKNLWFWSECLAFLNIYLSILF